MINEAAEGDIDAFKRGNIDKLRKYYPFIQIDSLSGEAAMLDAEEIVRTYRAQQARREDHLVEALEEGRSVAFDDISHLASDDLARFIVHRALVIDSLAKMPRESAEDVLHAAILRKHSDGSDIRENNVWLVDDKFLSYSNIYSNETLARIVREVLRTRCHCTYMSCRPPRSLSMRGRATVYLKRSCASTWTRTFRQMTRLRRHSVSGSP